MDQDPAAEQATHAPDNAAEVQARSGEPEPGAPAAAPQMPGGWGYRDVAYLILFAAAALVIVNAVGFAIYFAQGHLRGSPPSVLDSLTSAPLALAVQFVWSLTVLWFIYWRITARYGLPFGPAIGWTTRGHSRFHYLFLGLLLNLVVSLGITLLPKPEQPLPIQALMLQDQLSFLLVALFTVFLAPVVEELLFRGFLFPVFERSHGSFVAILLTSAMFTALHGRQNAWQWQVLLGLFLVGAAFGAVRAGTRSVVPATFMHAGYNLTMVLLLLWGGAKL